MPPAPRSKNPNFPKYVGPANGRLVYRPYIPADKRHLVQTDKGGFLKPPVKLGKVGDPEERWMRAYLAAKEEIEAKLTGRKKFTLYWLRDEYHQSRQFKELAPKSQKNAELMSRLLEHAIKIDGQPATLGDLTAARLTTPMLRSLFEKRLAKYQSNGKKGSAMVNRERAWFSAMLTWGIQHIEGLGLPTNPCHGIKGFKEEPATRYVTDAEYDLQVEIASQLYPYMPVVYELAYLCAARGIEVTDLTKASIKDQGLEVDRRKGSEDNGILWTPRLQAAVAAAKAMHKEGKVATMALLVNMHGQRLTKAAIESAQQRIKEKMEEIGKGDVYWNLHALKRKGVSDAEDKRIAGHKTEAMQRRYDVLKTWHEPPA